MKRTEKELKVKEIHEEFTEAKSAVLLDYKGLNVAEITDLRRKLREVSVDLKVIKNTLTKLASENTAYDAIKPFLIGPTAAAISKNDPVGGLKILDEFIKANPKLEYKAAVIEGTLVDKTQISKYADLPSRDVLVGMLLGTMQAPVAGFVRVMAGNLTGLLNVMNGIKESKE